MPTILGRVGNPNTRDVQAIRGKFVPPDVIVPYPGTNASIPTGWTRVPELDSRYVKQLSATTADTGGTGGGTGHNHPYGTHNDHGFCHAAHTFPNTFGSCRYGCGCADVYRCRQGGSAFASKTHTHTLTQSATTTQGQGLAGPSNYNCTTTESPNLVVIFIKSDGSQGGIPNNALAFFNGAAPSGWAAYANAANRLLKGAAGGGDGGGTGGTGCSHTHASACHAHLSAPHCHTMTIGGASSAGLASGVNAGGGINMGHTHGGSATSYMNGGATSGNANETSAAGDVTPPWQKMRIIQNTSGVPSLPTSIIAMWRRTVSNIPDNWKLCDGTGGTPNLSQDKFVRGAATDGEVGNLGGASTHTHSGSGHTHTGSSHTHKQPTHFPPGACNCIVGVSCVGRGASQSHNHDKGTSLACDKVSCSASWSLLTRSTASGSNSTNEPLFVRVAYIQYLGT